MSVRMIIILLALPLFLMLAAVNSLLLYREQSKDVNAGLRGQALAAAVTVAEFAKSSQDPLAELAQPHRLAALHGGTRNITGLEALYVVRAGQPPLNLIEKPLIGALSPPTPTSAKVLGTREGPGGRPIITAIAPAGEGTTVVADIDAQPLVQRTGHLKRLTIGLVSGSAALAILLGLLAARRVILEFRRTRAIIDARGRQAGEQLRIQEIRDLADAVHLIQASIASELQRLDASGTSDAAVGIASVRYRAFPDLAISAGTLRLSIRVLPTAPPGSFYVAQPREAGCFVALGEVDGEPAEALAGAMALRRFVEADDPDRLDERLAAASRLFGVSRMVTQSVSADGGKLVLLLNGNSRAALDYVERLPELGPEELTHDLAMLFIDAGIVAVALPA